MAGHGMDRLVWKNKYRTFQLSKKLQQVMRYDQEHDSSVWWHTGELEFESYSTFERNRYLIWERYKKNSTLDTF
jgi:hypothetical protein